MSVKRTAGVREAKARLSEFLRRVEAGKTVLITDRGAVVAELRSPGGPAVDPKATGDEKELAALVSQQRLRPPLGATRVRKWKGLGLKKGVAQHTLDQLREDR